MRGRSCSVCLHPRHQEIDEALMAGGTLVATAQRFGPSKSAMARHKSGCLAPRLAAAARMVTPGLEVRGEVARAHEIAGGAAPSLAEITTMAGLLGRLARSLERLETAADGAAAKDGYVALAALSGQLARAVEVAGRLQGLGGAAPVEDQGARFAVNIIISDGARAAAAVRAAPAAVVEGVAREVVQPEPPTDVPEPVRADQGVFDVPGFVVTFDAPGAYDAEARTRDAGFPA